MWTASPRQEQSAAKRPLVNVDLLDPFGNEGLFEVRRSDLCAPAQQAQLDILHAELVRRPVAEDFVR
jgi:hypothetical protein